MNRPQSPCLHCHKRSEACHGTCGPYRWYRAEQELYREFVGMQKSAERIDYPDSQMKRMRGQK